MVSRLLKLWLRSTLDIQGTGLFSRRLSVLCTVGLVVVSSDLLLPGSTAVALGVVPLVLVPSETDLYSMELGVL